MPLTYEMALIAQNARGNRPSRLRWNSRARWADHCKSLARTLADGDAKLEIKLLKIMGAAK